MSHSDIFNNIEYLKLLSKQYPTIDSVCSEIINLKAILNLPKGTEHFLTDLHGEHEAFTHVLRNASGVLKLKIEELYGNILSDKEKKSLATLIYYPEEKIQLLKNSNNDLENWYKITLHRLIKICRVVSSKYTRSKVRKALPEHFSYIIEELLREDPGRLNKQNYYNEIINSMIEIENADQFIIAICKLIQRLSVDKLHIVGDIYDRGPGAHLILDELLKHHDVDIQWGNHDILWMGAAAGSKACITNVIRICTRYANLETLEDGYGINLLPLATFAMEFYKNDPCLNFNTKFPKDTPIRDKDLVIISKMHKAISIIQFKIEGQIIKNSPEYKMDNRLLLDKIDYEKGNIKIDNSIYELNDKNFPTIDPKDPYKLNLEEENLMDRLVNSFLKSEKLQKHIKFLYSKGSIYLTYNSNLLYHGCIPMNENGSYKSIKFNGQFYKGKDLLDLFDKLARDFYFCPSDIDKDIFGQDVSFYLWCGEGSPLFGKDQMKTFERYFISDKETHIENKDAYFSLRNDENICKMILKDFNLDPLKSHIINGHVPVKTKNGESPMKANGKMLVIDGGFSKAYQPTTGIAGYTLIYNSYNLRLVSHQPFESVEKAINEEQDIVSTIKVLEKNDRKFVKDTDIGKQLLDQINSLKKLLEAYRRGLLKEVFLK